MKKSAWIVLGLSLAANAGLVAALTIRRTESRPIESPAMSGVVQPTGSSSGPLAHEASATAATAPATSPVTDAAGGGAKTKTLWELLRSRDPKEFAANLRAAGFAVGSVRGAVYALLRDLQTAERVKAVGLITDGSFWKSSVSREETAAYGKEISRLWLERDRIMRSIFPEEQLAFTLKMQARFGSISAEKMERISALEQDYGEMESQLRAQSNSSVMRMPWNSDQMAFLEKEKLKDLQGLLSPQEFEHYQMKGSSTGASLQRILDGFDPTEQEYRDIYRQRAALDDAMRTKGLLYRMSPEAQTAQRNTEASLKNALGETRYAEYQRSSDSAYQMALRVTRDLGLPATTANAVYEMQRDIRQRETDVRMGKTQNPADRTAQLNALSAELKQKLSTLLGPAGAEQYTKNRGGLFFLSQ